MTYGEPAPFPAADGPRHDGRGGGARDSGRQRPGVRGNGLKTLAAMDAQDIDTPTDWRLAELKMQLARSAQ